MFKKLFFVFPLFALLFTFSDAYAQHTATRVLTLADAKTIVDAAEERARQNSWNVAIVLVDAGGHLLYLRRIDGTQLASIEIAIQKAKTAVFYKRSTKALQDGMRDNVTLMGLPGYFPFEGGIPIEHNGQIIGAIGVSGVTGQQDGIIAKAGVDALTR